MSDAAGGLLDVGDLLAPVVGDDVLGGEVVVDVDAELALARVLGQVADVAVGGEDPVVGAEIALDRARLGRRLDDHEVLRHGRECSTGSCTDPFAPSGRPSDLADAAEEVLVDLEVRLGVGARAVGPEARSDARHDQRPARPPAVSRRRQDLDEPDVSQGKKKIEALSSTKTGRLPSSLRRFVQRSVVDR